MNWGEVIRTLGHSIICKWLSPFSWQWLVAGTVNKYIRYIYIYIYIPACFSHVTGSVLSYHPFYLLSASLMRGGAVSQLVLLFYYACYLFYTLEQWLLHLFSPSPRVGWVVWGLYPSFRPDLLCRNNLDRARGILDNWRHGGVYAACFGGFNCCVCAITERCEGIGVQEWSIAWGSYWFWCCTWYWGWCGLEFALSEEKAVSKCDPSWSINPDSVLLIR